MYGVPICLRKPIVRPPPIAAMLVALSGPAHSECLPSAEAVWAAHPGSHPAWHLRLPGHLGEKCWYAKDSTNLPAPHVRQQRVVDSPRRTEADRQTDGQTKASSSQVKASVADVPRESPARVKSQDTLTATEREPLSILIWGRPMQVDAMWEEMFARRQRDAE